MATDDERWRVANILRGGYDVVSDACGRFWLNGTLFGIDITARSEEQIRDGLSRLADLIEPPARCPHYHSDRHYCSVHEDMALIDRDALLALADECDSVHMHKVARRIREACGEVA